MQSTKAAKYFSECIYENLNIEGKAGGEFKSLYELSCKRKEIEGEEGIFQFDQINPCSERMVKKASTKVSKL